MSAVIAPDLRPRYLSRTACKADASPAAFRSRSNSARSARTRFFRSPASDMREAADRDRLDLNDLRRPGPPRQHAEAPAEVPAVPPAGAAALAAATRAAKAASSRAAMSASDLRSRSMPARLRPAMNWLYEMSWARAAALMRMIHSRRKSRFF